MAQDDPDFRHLRKENSIQTLSKSVETPHPPPPLSDKTNLPSNPSSPKKKSSPNSDENHQAPYAVAITTQQSGNAPADFQAKDAPCDNQDLQDSQQSSITCEEGMPSSVCGACGGNGNGGRWDKSLGVLCQKFVMLFLVTPVS